MKKVYQLIATASLSLLTVGLFAQSIPNGSVKAKIGSRMMAKMSPKSHATHKATGAYTYAYMDYPFDDSVAQSFYYVGGTYMGAPSVGQFYIQQMNMHYTMKDTGAEASNGQPVNALLIHNCTVSFDTLLDASSGMGYSGTNVVVDSLYIPIGQANASGKNDTLVVQIVSVGKFGIPTSTVLWSQSIIQDTGLSGKGNPWNSLGFLGLAPNLTLASGSKFAVVLNYYDETKLDTCGFLYGAPGYNCAALGGVIPDTAVIGDYINITGGGHVRANSFTTGYNYFTGATPKNSNPILSLPSTTYGGAFYFPCTPDTTIGLDWQDVVIYAEVKFMPSAVNNITDNGLAIGQNYPNPFNKTTQISYSLTKSSDVMFNVYDMTGRKLISTSYGDVAPGQHTINLSANQFTLVYTSIHLK